MAPSARSSCGSLSVATPFDTSIVPVAVHDVDHGELDLDTFQSRNMPSGPLTSLITSPTCAGVSKGLVARIQV